ncbi:alpha/beta fold hydrolase [Kocuria sediminis]|uniref:Alpha/beta fold hydrolase n=1 Tax=Kocuria sediminis TaxID=1038857 RepID=A0A6N8GRS3_9MICC|nr:alpha/beta fold hydrolase [Kocuria sediminis]
MLRSTRSGSGAPTVLLLPGLLCTQQLWDRARPLLEAFHDVLTVDLPGVGGDLPEGPADLAAYADRVCEVLDAEEIERCVWVGHSLGGYVLAAALERHAARISHAVLAYSTTAADDAAARAGRDKGIAAVQEQGVGAYARRQMPRTFREDARREDVEAAVRQAQDWPEAAVVRALEAMRDRPDRTPLLLEHAELPVLLVQGDDDPAIGALDPQERHVTRIVTDTAHMGVLTDPHTFAGIVHGWVADEIERSA